LFIRLEGDADTVTLAGLQEVAHGLKCGLGDGLLLVCHERHNSESHSVAHTQSGKTKESAGTNRQKVDEQHSLMLKRQRTHDLVRQQTAATASSDTDLSRPAIDG
jgi:hypothetical protein